MRSFFKTDGVTLASSTGRIGRTPPDRMWSRRYQDLPRAAGWTDCSSSTKSGGRLSPFPLRSRPAVSYAAIMPYHSIISSTAASVYTSVRCFGRHAGSPPAGALSAGSGPSARATFVRGSCASRTKLGSSWTTRAILKVGSFIASSSDATAASLTSKPDVTVEPAATGAVDEFRPVGAGPLLLDSTASAAAYAADLRASRCFSSGSASHATALSAPQSPRSTPTAAATSDARRPPRTEPSRRATSARSADSVGRRAGSPRAPRMSSRAAERLLVSATRASCDDCMIFSRTLKPCPAAVEPPSVWARRLAPAER